MNNAEKALFASIANDPGLESFKKRMRERSAQRKRWKPGIDAIELVHDSGFCDGIEFVLKQMGYDRDR